ncbi:hypothetical protein E2I00_003807, partial [Balaenoptera physalus]
SAAEPLVAGPDEGGPCAVTGTGLCFRCFLFSLWWRGGEEGGGRVDLNVFGRGAMAAPGGQGEAGNPCCRGCRGRSRASRPGPEDPRVRPRGAGEAAGVSSVELIHAQCVLGSFGENQSHPHPTRLSWKPVPSELQSLNIRHDVCTSVALLIRVFRLGHRRNVCRCVDQRTESLGRVYGEGVTLIVSFAEILQELDEYYEKFKRETDGAQRRRVLPCIQRALIRSQELGDEKIQIVSQMVELVENRARQVDSHVELFEAHQEVSDTTGHSKAGQDKSKTETVAQAEKPNSKRSRRQRNNENRENAANNHDHDDITSGTPKEKKAKASKKKKRSKAKAEREASPADLPIDPNEPTYCLCNQVSYGEMIGCDNDECPIEWFHFSCVGLNHKPKGKWYCPKCRGENEKTMDKALEKSKKERAYNR